MKYYQRGTSEQFETYNTRMAIEKGIPIYSQKFAHSSNINDYFWPLVNYEDRDKDFPILTSQEVINNNFVQGDI